MATGLVTPVRDHHALVHLTHSTFADRLHIGVYLIVYSPATLSIAL